MAKNLEELTAQAKTGWSDSARDLYEAAVLSFSAESEEMGKARNE